MSRKRAKNEFEEKMGLLLEQRKTKTRKERIMKKKAVASTVSVRRQAALKAWETRRAQALARKRSEAARKAWETRQIRAILDGLL